MLENTVGGNIHKQHRIAHRAAEPFQINGFFKNHVDMDPAHPAYNAFLLRRFFGRTALRRQKCRGG